MPRWPFRPPIERTKQGFRINLDASERDLVGSLLGEMRSLLMGPADAPGLKRVFPAAYHLPEHAEHDAEYQRLMREELVVSRLTGIATIEEALATKDALTEAQLLAFAQGLNGLRLVLGTLLDVTEDHDPEDIEATHPQAAEYHLYGYLSWLLEWTVRALTGT
jgi:Domain of unknown function (DUF2017)